MKRPSFVGTSERRQSLEPIRSPRLSTLQQMQQQYESLLVAHGGPDEIQFPITTHDELKLPRFIFAARPAFLRFGIMIKEIEQVWHNMQMPLMVYSGEGVVDATLADFQSLIVDEHATAMMQPGYKVMSTQGTAALTLKFCHSSKPELYTLSSKQ